MRTAKLSSFTLICLVLGSFVLAFIIAPLAKLVLSTSSGEFADAFRDTELWASIWLTLRAAAFATVVSTIFGVPLAYLLARSRFPGRALVLGIVDLPIMIPHSAAGIALLTLIGRHSLAQRAAAPFGLDFVGAEAGIAVATMPELTAAICSVDAP